jgi:hypothetical protein
MFWTLVGVIVSWFYVAPTLVDMDYSGGGKYYKKDLNFGVVVKNDKHTLYRSEILGKSGLEKLYKHLDKNKLPRPKTVIYMNKNGYGGWSTGFDSRAIQEYELQAKYRYKFFHSYDQKYRTYLDGDNPYYPSKDIDQSKYMNGDAKKYFGLIEDGKADGGADAFVRIMNIVLDPARQPVLFHCAGGRHRTGMVAMMIRYLQGGEWINGEQTKVWIQGKNRYLNHAQYEYYLHNSDLVRFDNWIFIDQFFKKESDLISQWKNLL